jgi:glycosyltransferase involved in cell wall biosynthesis
MACGTPVVASIAGSLPEICGDAALIVDPTDPQAMATAIGEILTSHDATHTLSTAGTERAAGFTWEASAKATRSVYEGLL